MTTQGDKSSMEDNAEPSDFMGENKPSILLPSSRPSLEVAAQQLVAVFNHSPYMQLNGMQMRFEDDTIRCYLDAKEALIGNVTFKILHGGVAATMLDSIGGIVAMLEIYRRNQDSFSEQFKKISRLATVDLRIDYIAPGKGEQFIASAEVIRMGRKGCTSRMQMVNNEGKLIAVGIASFAF